MALTMVKDLGCSASIASIRSALRDITELLAAEITTPTVEPNWSDFEWRIAEAVSAIQGISQLLPTLPWRGPERWRRFIENQRTHIERRHRRIERLLSCIDHEARRAGIALVALKGAALHARGVYQCGERPMADVDLLVKESEAEAAVLMLENCGYARTFTTWRHVLLEPREKTLVVPPALGEHEDNPIKVELHTSVRERLPVEEFDITGIVFPHLANAGLNDYPSDISLMAHLLIHAAGNMRANALRLIQLHDIARLATRLSGSDWVELQTLRVGGRGLWWAMPPLLLAAKYYPRIVPGEVIAGLTHECPKLLQKRAQNIRLNDVSWTNLRVRALPGIEWCRSPSEALSFMFRRAFPNDEARKELKRFAEHHPGGSDIPWYGISQFGRILRWTFLRPPRVQAMLPVYEALCRQIP